MPQSLNPLPSLLRASAWDAGNFSMRKAGRSKWNEDDYKAAAATQERLIRACYGRDSDGNEPNRCYIRFQIAESLERAGRFGLRSTMVDVQREVDAIYEAA